MRFVFNTALLTCKRMLRRPGMIFAILLLPAVCALAGLYLSGGGEVFQIRVGVSIYDGDSFGRALYDGLERFDGPIIFERHADADFLDREVAAGRMECAYLISPQLGQNLYRGRARGGITLLEHPNTIMDVLAGEMILASMLREIAPQMNRELLADILNLDPDHAAEFVARKYAYYDARPEIFLQPVFQYHTGGGVQAEPPLPTGARVLHGMIALLLLAGVIWSLPGLVRESPGILRRLPPGPSRAFMFGTGLGIFLVGLMQGALGLIALAAVYPAALVGGFTVLSMLCAYLLCLSLSAVAAILVLRRSDVIYAGGSFLLILTAVLGGVFIDLAEVSPPLAVVSALFPTRHYIDGVLGVSLISLLWLLVPAIACALLVFLLSAKHKV